MFACFFMLSKLFLPKMTEYKSGKIVFVSSVWGQKGACMESVYSATKWAMIGFAKSLALEVAPSNINVNCVCPGVIDTPMNKHLSTEDINELKEQTPLYRIGKASDVANLIYYLGSDEADFITGQVISVDGGFLL